MDMPKQSAGGDLVYLSLRKLNNLSVQIGLSADVAGPITDLTLQGSVGISLGSIGHAEIGASHSQSRVDLSRNERALHDQLAKVIRMLEPGGLPRLDDGDKEIFEGNWFWFHRPLRFGVGTDDSAHSVRALLAVDEEPVDETSPWPGLLMNGAPTHVLPPYSVDLESAGAMRSGSGTGALFQWLDRVRSELESHPRTAIEELELGDLPSSPSLRGHETAISMYRMFAHPGFNDRFGFSQLLNGAPCEGVAQASLIAMDDQVAVVLASPLFIRVRSFTPVEIDPPEEKRSGRLKRFLRIPNL
jgi:hypothetical protein